jgi:hypothetical protein
VSEIGVDPGLTTKFTATRNSQVWRVKDFLVEKQDDFLGGLVDNRNEGTEEEEALWVKTKRKNLCERMEECVFLVVIVVKDLSNVINDGCLTYSDNPMGNDEGYGSEPNGEYKPKD